MNEIKIKNKTGLVLTGGGARAAYQVGALKGIIELAAKQGIINPFPIITGSSAGSINAAFLASNAHQLSEYFERLERLWRSLSSHQIYQTKYWSLFRIGFRLILELSMGNLISWVCT